MPYGGGGGNGLFTRVGGNLAGGSPQYANFISGTDNLFVGDRALQNLERGTGNIAIGFDSQSGAVDLSACQIPNITLGNDTLKDDGSCGNIVIGNSALDTGTSQNSLIIMNCDTPAAIGNQDRSVLISPSNLGQSVPSGAGTVSISSPAAPVTVGNFNLVVDVANTVAVPGNNTFIGKSNTGIDIVSDCTVLGRINSISGDRTVAIGDNINVAAAQNETVNIGKTISNNKSGGTLIGANLSLGVAGTFLNSVLIGSNTGVSAFNNEQTLIGRNFGTFAGSADRAMFGGHAFNRFFADSGVFIQAGTDGNILIQSVLTNTLEGISTSISTLAGGAATLNLATNNGGNTSAVIQSSGGVRSITIQSVTDANSNVVISGGNNGKSLTVANAGTSVAGSLTASDGITAGIEGLRVVEGANSKQGTANMVNSSVVVANTSVTANSRIFVTAQDNNVAGTLRISARIPGVSFTIQSGGLLQSGLIAYQIFEPG